MLAPLLGEVWRADLEPIRGHEQGKARPVLIVSNDVINRSPAEMVTVLPITTRERPLRSFLRVQPPEGGLKQISFVICDQVRTISKERLERRYGMVSPATLAEAKERLRFLLDL
jgi:mRNA interferase MazF